MDFQRLSVFRAAARHLSFSRAADELHLSQPAVSKHVRQLEAELGVQLFQRLGKRVELTDAGRIAADYAQRVATLTEEVRRVLGELEGVRRGYLRLGASSTPGLYFLPEILARFRRQYPGVEITLAISNSAEVTRRTRAGDFDLGFAGEAGEAPGLQVRPFADDEIVLILPAGHALAQQRQVVPDMFAHETLIVREAGSGTRRIAEAHMAGLGLAPRQTLELVGCEAVKRAVAAGLGVAFVSQHAIALEVTQGLLQAPEIPELRFARQLWLLARKDARPSPATLAFLSLALKG